MAAHDGAASLPEYPSERLTLLTLDALIELLVAAEDRAPRTLVDECASRGETMVGACARLVEDDGFWEDEVGDGQWWLRLHAVMILGLIPGERAGAVLVSFMRRMDVAEDQNLQSWLDRAWPALFSNKPDTVLPGLRALAQDRDVDWYMRAQALDCVIAPAARTGGAVFDTALDWVAGIAADETEDWEFRICAGNALLDFPRERHRALLDELADQQTRPFVSFDRDDVAASYRAGADRPEWERWEGPWRFYRGEAIAQRQARYAREAAEKLPPADRGVLEKAPLPYVRARAKIGRNDPCPCGSGKKYKRCCMGKDEG